MTAATLKEWPRQSLVIVCAAPGEFCPEQIEGVAVARRCFDCGGYVLVDSCSIDQALDMPERRERPVSFLCTACAMGYDRRSIDILRDRRPR